MTRRKLHVIFRTCGSHVVPRPRPPFFSKRLGFCSLLTAIHRHGDCDLTVVQDGQIDDAVAVNIPTWASVQYTTRRGNVAAFETSLALASNDLDRCVYFSEDDYLYKPDALNHFVECITTTAADYATLYDHPARYRVPTDDVLVAERPFVTRSHHWHRVESTCLTFGCHGSTVTADAQRILTLLGGHRYPEDRSMWRSLQQLVPTAAVGPPRVLVGPIPSLACHADLRDGLSPTVDWSALAADLEAVWG